MSDIIEIDHSGHHGSALYRGLVLHRRFGAVEHTLRYRMAMALLDLDQLDALDARLRLFSRNRFNLFSFHDRDHLPKDAPPGTTLRGAIEAELAIAGLDLGGGAIRLLSLPRILGHAFNPLSVYFCHDADDRLGAILYEVNNTFGQRHSYLIPVDGPDAACGVVAQSCDKVFYVSPFLDMNMRYDFRILPPGEHLSVAVDGSRDGTRIISASFAGARGALTDAALLKSFLRHPLLSLAVVAGIHWEALKLWRKGVRLRARPAPPSHSVSYIPRREV